MPSPSPDWGYLTFNTYSMLTNLNLYSLSRRQTQATAASQNLVTLFCGYLVFKVEPAYWFSVYYKLSIKDNSKGKTVVLQKAIKYFTMLKAMAEDDS